MILIRIDKMNKEIEMFDLAIEKLQQEKIKTIKKIEEEKKKGKEKVRKQITPQDDILISKLAEQAEWWRTDGPTVEKTIKITIKANILWIEDRTPYIDSYGIHYNGKDADDLHELINNVLFENYLKMYQKQINKICNKVSKLEKKYPDAKINEMIF